MVTGMTSKVQALQYLARPAFSASSSAVRIGKSRMLTMTTLPAAPESAVIQAAMLSAFSLTDEVSPTEVMVHSLTGSVV